jgi:hypothetical protein
MARVASLIRDPHAGVGTTEEMRSAGGWAIASVLARSAGRIVFPNTKSQPAAAWFYLARASDRRRG